MTIEWGLECPWTVAASWAETEHWQPASAGESQHALMICYFLAHAYLIR